MHCAMNVGNRLNCAALRPREKRCGTDIGGRGEEKDRNDDV